MKLTTSGLCLAAAFAFAASLGAQTATSSATQSSSDKEISVTGCLEKAPSGGYVLSNAKMDTETSGAASSTSGTSGTTGGTTSGTMSATTGSTWMLEGDSSDLEKHVGHKVQVTGKETEHGGMSGSTTTSTTTTTGTSGTASSSTSRRLDVKSVKMVSTTCP